MDYVTPAEITLEEGTYQIDMPSNHIIGSNSYTFKSWENGNTNPTRIINITDDTELLASYDLIVPPPTPPPPKSFLQIHAFSDGTEVSVNGIIDETGQTFTTPITLELTPATYTVRLTLLGITQTVTVTVPEGKTVRVDIQFEPTPDRHLFGEGIVFIFTAPT